jgi:two-component system chemotaxis response regulator CheY
MRKINSLVVEDNVINQKIMYNILKEFGKCAVAENGVEGLKLVKKAISEQNYYDLICLDIEMPQMDGINLLNMIRKIEKTIDLNKKSTIIMITARGEKEIVRECCRLGCNSFLVKPVDKYNFTKMLKRYNLVS